MKWTGLLWRELAFPRCVAIYSVLSFMHLTSFIAGLPLSQPPFRLLWNSLGRKNSSFASIWILDAEITPQVVLGTGPPLFYSDGYALNCVTFKQWLCEIWLVSKEKYSSHPKDWQEHEMAEAVLSFFWQELIGQEILRRAQHRIPSYHSAWLDALRLQLESLSKIVGGGTSSLTKLYWEKTCSVLIY